MKKVSALILLAIFAMSNMAYAELKIGQAFPSTTLADQFDKKHTVKNTDKLVLISFERQVSAVVSSFLLQQPTEFLANKHCLYIADISAMPSLIAKLFGLPKMRDYNYSVMLNTEENFAEKYNTKAGKLTVYKLNQGIIESIQFIDASELAGVFN